MEGIIDVAESARAKQAEGDQEKAHSAVMFLLGYFGLTPRASAVDQVMTINGLNSEGVTIDQELMTLQKGEKKLKVFMRVSYE